MRRICAASAAVLVATGLASPGHAALTVSSHATQNVSCSSGICTATRSSAFVRYSDLQAMLAGGDVTLVSSVAEDIVVPHAFHWASTHALALDAQRSIQIDARIDDQGDGGVTLTTNDGGSGGTLSFGDAGSLSFLGMTNPLTINGLSYTLVGDIASLAADIASAPAGKFALAHNYDAKGDGVYASTPVTTTFAGRLEGLGNAISRFTLRHTASDIDAEALISTIGAGGAAENLVLKGEIIRTTGKDNRFAGLTGYNQGSIFGVRVDLQGVATRSYNRASNCLAAGIADYNGGTIDRSSASGSISCGPGGYAGGLVAMGYSGSVIKNSHASVAVEAGITAYAPFAAGGLQAQTYGDIVSSYATGTVTGALGRNSAGAGGNIGGLLGIAAGGDYGLIANSYATGNITGALTSNVGGLIGYNSRTGPPFDKNIENCYSTGAVSGDLYSKVGGLVGYTYGSPGFVDDYWDMTTSGVTDPSKGAGNRADETGITGLTDAQLKFALPTGFDLSVWGQNGAINNGWPYLLGNTPQ
jgi:hypothetical protein